MMMLWIITIITSPWSTHLLPHLCGCLNAWFPLSGQNHPYQTAVPFARKKKLLGGYWSMVKRKPQIVWLSSNIFSNHRCYGTPPLSELWRHGYLSYHWCTDVKLRILIEPLILYSLVYFTGVLNKRLIFTRQRKRTGNRVCPYIYMCVCVQKKIVIERTRDLIYLKFVATDFFQ